MTLPKPPDKQGVHLLPEPQGASPASTQNSPQSQGATPISLHWVTPPPHLPDRPLGILTVKELPPSPCTEPRPLPTSQTQTPGGPHCQGLWLLSPSQWMESMPSLLPGLSMQAEPTLTTGLQTPLWFPLNSGFPLTLLTAAFRGKDSSSKWQRREEEKGKGEDEMSTSNELDGESNYRTEVWAQTPD